MIIEFSLSATHQSIALMMHFGIFVKELSRSLLRMMPQYRQEQRRENTPFDISELEHAVRKAIKDVPYYRDYGKYLDNGKFDLTKLPIIRKSDIMGHSEELVSRRATRRLMIPKKTGGSTGVSLQLYYSLSTVIRKTVVNDNTMKLIASKPRLAVLRGHQLTNGKVWQRSGINDILLSSYALSADTVDDYLKALSENRVNIIQAYPSSLYILAKLIKRRYGTANLPDLKGFVVSSEVFEADKRKLVAEVFPGTKIIDLYGHNELAAFAISVNGAPYEFHQHYGYVEFIPTGEVVNGHRVAEIVATSILNSDMPLIRYATDDYVELDDAGRPVAIIGRTSDFVVNKKNEITPCIVLTRSESMQNLTNFQYYQDRPGHLVFRVIPTDDFTEQDKKLLLEDFDKSFNGLMDSEIECIKEIPRTKIGKQKRLIQEVDLSDYQ